MSAHRSDGTVAYRGVPRSLNVARVVTGALVKRCCERALRWLRRCSLLISFAVGVVISFDQLIIPFLSHKSHRLTTPAIDRAGSEKARLADFHHPVFDEFDALGGCHGIRF